MKGPLPGDEEERLKALRRYQILDTVPSREFDDIVLLAAHICGTATAMISLVDEKRQWFKAKVGTPLHQTSREIAFCAHGILQREVFIVKDAQADARFSSNPLVTGETHIRFYAGAPLLSPEGHVLGMLCVTDQEPRELTPGQMSAMQALSRQAVALMELRRGTMEFQEMVTQLKSTREDLEQKTAFFEALVDSSLDGILVVNEQNQKVLQNQRTVELLKLPRHVAEDPGGGQQLRWVATSIKNPGPFLERVEYIRSHPDQVSRDEVEFKDGTILDRYSAPVVGQEGQSFGRIFAFRDMTARKRLEAQFLQSQKMETVGKLAGGIAHEFNSILTAIIGQSELLLIDLPPASRAAHGALEIRQAAASAAALTRQLLAFGRRQILQPEHLDLNQLLSELIPVFTLIMAGGVEMQFVPAPALPAVQADRGQIEQVLLNIVNNARDAMPNGGKLTLETARVAINEESLGRYPELKAGSYVMVAITDTGIGMSAEVKARVFEPFFTTKEVGQGTGLGLSTCYGIVKQSGGHLGVYSEPGRGTAFKIYLPQADRPLVNPSPAPSGSATLPGGTETILLVEDDPALREMLVTLLTRLGYKVWAAVDGVEALMLQQKPEVGYVDLLFTDVVMPHMGGKELADRVRSLHPRTRILFSSAYTENAAVYQGVLDKGAALLQKPFTPSALAHKVREVLGQP